MDGSYALASWIFLRAIGAIFLIAFCSLGVQVRGLIGARGIVPAAEFLGEARRQLGRSAYRFLPSLFWLDASDRALVGACVLGAGAAALVVLDVFPFPALALCWLLYLSLTSVGQPFMGYQWDALLLETGFFSLLLAPALGGLGAAGSPPLAVWILWGLLFRLLFESGVGKLTSGDPAWRSFEALSYHYETQPLPTWIGWWAHQLPRAFHRFSTAAVYAIEIVLPLLILAPGVPRLPAAAGIVFLQALIMATGNYNFFNLLTIALCVPLLDDSFWASFFTGAAPSASALPGGPVALGAAAAVCLLVGAAQAARALRPTWEPPAPLGKLERLLSPFQLINPYGLFRVMTTRRLEVVIEGSDDRASWKSYEFRWKPGDPRRRPGFVEPHQPRLDWQLWFAALSPYYANPWFVGLLRRLLTASPEVLALLKDDPFHGRPPRFVRTLLYEYRFTGLGTLRKEGRWWERTALGPYCPECSLAPSEEAAAPPLQPASRP